MKQKNIILILVSSLVILLVAVVFSLTNFIPPKPQPSVIPKEQPKIFPQKEGATLKFSPDSTTLLIGDVFEAGVMINTEEEKVTAAELYINYDPTKLEVKEVKAGEFFEKSDVLLNQVDEAGGKISFALGSLSPKSGIGRLALIRVRALEETPSTQLSFDASTQIAAMGKASSVLKEVSSAKFTILP